MTTVNLATYDSGTVVQHPGRMMVAGFVGVNDTVTKDGVVYFKVEVDLNIRMRGPLYSASDYYLTIHEQPILDAVKGYVGEERFTSLEGSQTEDVSNYTVEWTGNSLTVRISVKDAFERTYAPVISWEQDGYGFEMTVSVVTANYAPTNIPVTYSYTNSEGITTTASETYNLNQSVKLHASLLPEGKTSQGWFLAANIRMRIGAPESTSNMMTLTGYEEIYEAILNSGVTADYGTGFTLVEYEGISDLRADLDPRGGTVTPTFVTVRNGEPFPSLPTPVRDGHEFHGWFEDLTFNSKVIPKKTKCTWTEHGTLYALWDYEVLLFSQPTSENFRGRTYYGSTKITHLSLTGVQGYRVMGISTDSAGATPLATIQSTDSTEATFLPDVPGFVDSSGKNLLYTPYQAYLRWEIEEYNIIFDANGGETPSFTTLTTKNWRIWRFPSTIWDGFVQRGWFIKDEEGQITIPVDQNTLFFADTTVYALWDSEQGADDLLCYLEKRISGEVTRVVFPIVTSIDDSFTANLVEMETIVFGYANRFVTDMGTKRSFTLNVKRINPMPYDDESEDPRLHSNAKWWKSFQDFINFWQNSSHSASEERTGGFRFVYMPRGKRLDDQGNEIYTDFAELYPKIIANVFIAGQITAKMTPGVLNMTVPLVVASMKPDADLVTWTASFTSGEFTDVQPFEFKVTGIWGLPLTMPSPPDTWVAYAQKQSDPMTFAYWQRVDVADDTKYYANRPFEFSSSYGSHVPVFKAVWAAISEIHIFTTCVKVDISQSLNDRVVARTDFVFKNTTDSMMYAQAILYGGGGTGGYCKDDSSKFVQTRCDAGGGGGASGATSASFYLNPGEMLGIRLGLGGNAFMPSSGGRAEELAPAVSNGVSTSIGRITLKDPENPPAEGAPIDLADYTMWDITNSSVGTTGGASRTPGIYNGGQGGENQPGGQDAQDGGGAQGGKRGNRDYVNPYLWQGWFGGGGGGGSLPVVNGDPQVLEVAGDSTTAKSPVYTFRGEAVHLHNYVGDVLTTYDLVTVDKKSDAVHIVVEGGEGTSYSNRTSMFVEDYCNCDAPNRITASSQGSETGRTNYIVFTGGGGGGKMVIEKSVENLLANLRYSRGAPGFVLLYVSKV